MSNNSIELKMDAAILGEDPIRGGAQCKVWLYHKASGVTSEQATNILTQLKEQLSTRGYEVIRDSSDGSFRLDQDGDKTLESSGGGTCLSMLFTHPNNELNQDEFYQALNDSLSRISLPQQSRGKS